MPEAKGKFRQMNIREALAKRLSSQEKTDFLAVLLRVARADEVSLAERDRMLPVLEWIAAGEPELTHAMQRADDPTIRLAELVRPFDTKPERYLLFRECCSVAWVDGYVSDDEKSVLDRLAVLLELEDSARCAMDSPLACSPEGERRFLELLEREPLADS